MAKRKIAGLRWWIIGVVMLGTVLNYLTRSSLSAAAPTLKEQLHISVEQYSYVVAAFQACYTVMQPVAGFILDSIGVKIGLAIFCVAWSLSNMLHGFAGNWQSLAFFRGLMGMAEAAVIPAGMKSVTEWFPAKERSIATGWFNIGSSIGAMLAPPLVIGCITYFNWQTAFLVTGGLGFFWVALWLFFFRTPAEHPQITEDERQYILNGQEASHKSDTTKPSIKQIVSRKEFWGIAIPKFLAEPAWQTFNFWIPLYLSTVRHMDLKSIAMFAWIPFLAADLGCIVGGYLSPLMMKYFKVSLLTSRKLVVVTGAICMLAPAMIGMVASPYTAIALFCVGTFAHQTLSGSLITMSADVFPKSMVGTVNGLTGMSGYLGATIFSLIVGVVASKIGYDPLFVCLSLFDVIGAVVVCMMIKSSSSPIIPESKTEVATA
ncbi:MFS transporter [Tolumonas lignilytica]|uniref:MFS transporter n=1 Tax=Tolumonas lignilytica TaxID=1283284 RepID=UPI0004648223|nr:MFS transporter [Tolumonas lignilytica]